MGSIDVVILALRTGFVSPPAGTPEQIDFDYARQLIGAIRGRSGAQLNVIMAHRAARTDAAYTAWTDLTHSRFAFNGDDEVRGTFDRLWPTYQQKIFNRYPELRTDTAFATSREAIVLASLIWNGPPTGPSSLLGAKLQGALLSGDRAEAWYQIRYESNGGSSEGEALAKRRFFESELLGLYDDPTAPTLIEAQRAYRMLEHRRKDIIAYADKGAVLELLSARSAQTGPPTLRRYSTSARLFPLRLPGNEGLPLRWRSSSIALHM